LSQKSRDGNPQRGVGLEGHMYSERKKEREKDKMSTFAPRLVLSGSHKGSSGRIAVVGGSEDYTGAPFFAAMASLRMGADQAVIFTSKEASVPMKSYSPDICVTPSYDRIFDQASKYHAIVCGPGLGRDLDVTRPIVGELIQVCVKKTIPLVLDADALFVLPFLGEPLRGYPWAVLTPNKVELERLCQELRLPGEPSGAALAMSLQGPTVVVKGEVDSIYGPARWPSDGAPLERLESIPEASPRRVSGQGDILSGCIATFLAWAKLRNGAASAAGDVVPQCAKEGCDTMRRAAVLAFEQKGRGAVSSDILNMIPSISSHL